MDSDTRPPYISEGATVTVEAIGTLALAFAALFAANVVSGTTPIESNSIAQIASMAANDLVQAPYNLAALAASGFDLLIHATDPDINGPAFALFDAMRNTFNPNILYPPQPGVAFRQMVAAITHPFCGGQPLEGILTEVPMSVPTAVGLFSHGAGALLTAREIFQSRNRHQ